jgi:hypothetical protein
VPDPLAFPVKASAYCLDGDGNLPGAVLDDCVAESDAPEGVLDRGVTNLRAVGACPERAEFQ